MTRIKIIDATNYETEPKKIAEHLRKFLLDIRTKQLSGTPISSDDADDFELPYKDHKRIDARAGKLAKARLTASGLSHLKREEYARLEPSLDGMQIAMSQSVDWADEIAASLHDEMPWMGRATEHVWHALRRAAQRGEPIALRPVILNGPPGIGKSVWVRSLATALSLPYADIDASKGGAGMSLVGTERGWSTAQTGRPLDLMLAKNFANPLIVVDEICKARSMTSANGAHHAFADALLSLLEPATAASWECPYFRTRFDMSHISWVLTSNVIENVPEPVRSRCQVIEIPDVSIAQLQWVARKSGAKRGLSEDAVEAVAMAVAQAPAVTKRRQSLRDVVRMLERAEVLEGRLRLQ